MHKFGADKRWCQMQRRLRETHFTVVTDTWDLTFPCPEQDPAALQNAYCNAYFARDTTGSAGPMGTMDNFRHGRWVIFPRLDHPIMMMIQNYP